MIATIVIVWLVIGVVVLVGLLVMAHRENRQLQEDLGAMVPFRDSQFATPHVPEQWEFSESDLEDPHHRSTPPSDPAS